MESIIFVFPLKLINFLLKKILKFPMVTFAWLHYLKFIQYGVKCGESKHVVFIGYRSIATRTFKRHVQSSKNTPKIRWPLADFYIPFGMYL